MKKVYQRLMYFLLCATLFVGQGTVVAEASSKDSAFLKSEVKNLKVVVQAATHIELKWDKLMYASGGYDVLRATSKTGKYKFLGGTTSTSFDDDTVKAGTTYYYKVCGVRMNSHDDLIYSRYSSIVSAVSKDGKIVSTSEADAKTSEDTAKEKPTSSEAFTYTLRKNEITITGLKDTKLQDIIIPSVINGYKVTGIGDEAFFRTNIRSINIPSSVVLIGKEAFNMCRYLKSFVVAEGCDQLLIGNDALRECSNLETLIIPSAKAKLTYAMFDRNTKYNKLTKVAIPNLQNCRFNRKTLKEVTILPGTTEIKDNMYENCENIKVINIPDSVVRIGANAFRGCTSLKAIRIPDSVTSIGEAAFFECSELKKVQLSKNLTLIDKDTFNSCPFETIDIPGGVTTIDNKAFYGCRNLKKITIPASVTSLGDNCFGFCKSLKEIKVPNSVTQIGEFPFQLCDNLSKIILPDSFLKTIGTNNILTATGITEVVIPDGVTSIAQKAFAGCNSLESVILPASVTNIENGAFNQCKSLKNITFSDEITNIGDYAFCGCISLTKVTLPTQLRTIGKSAFNYCLALTEVKFPTSITDIGNEAFSACKSLSLVWWPEKVSQNDQNVKNQQSSDEDYVFGEETDEDSEDSMGLDIKTMIDSDIFKKTPKFNVYYYE